MRPNTNINARNIQNTDELLLSDRYKQEYKYNMGDLARFVRYKPQVIIVAKSGGDYTSIQAGINSIKDASPSKIYTVLVFPGEYDEALTLKDYVNIIAIDPFNTYILRQVTDGGNPVHCDLRINIDNRQSDGSHGLYLKAASVIHIEGNVKGGNSTGSGGQGIYNYSAGIVKVLNGNVTGGIGGVNGGKGIYNYSTGTVTVINGNATGGKGAIGENSSYGIHNCSTGIIKVTNGKITTPSTLSTGYPIVGGNIVLTDCIIYGIHADVPAIYASGPKNVKLMNVWSNRALHANITNLIEDGFHVDADVEI